MRLFLAIILVLALGGLSFSGYLTYRELFGGPNAATCTPVGEPGGMLGAPPCVYGFAMYFAIAVLAILGLAKRPATR
jgi:uncharacterized membrane protein